MEITRTEARASRIRLPWYVELYSSRYLGTVTRQESRNWTYCLPLRTPAVIRCMWKQHDGNNIGAIPENSIFLKIWSEVSCLYTFKYNKDYFKLVCRKDSCLRQKRMIDVRAINNRFHVEATPDEIMRKRSKMVPWRDCFTLATLRCDDRKFSYLRTKFTRCCVLDSERLRNRVGVEPRRDKLLYLWETTEWAARKQASCSVFQERHYGRQ